jgi:site-specific recombinase XerD
LVEHLTFNQVVLGSSPRRLRIKTSISKQQVFSNLNQEARYNAKQSSRIIEQFIASRRDGLSTRTIDSYRDILRLSIEVIGLNTTNNDIQRFLNTRKCHSGGKHAYFRYLRAFYNWLFSRKSGYGLNSQDNPILLVDAQKVERKILPSLTLEQVDLVIGSAICIRDSAIISLFADSGLRLSEVANIELHNIDWQHRLIKVKCKGNKEGLEPFGVRTEKLLKQWLSQYQATDRLWDINVNGINIMMRRLMVKTGLLCNPHTFRRTFASILAKRGVDSLHIMRLGRWESISMVDGYTKSVRFEDSLKLYNPLVC